MSRPQIQEEAVLMLADALQALVKPDGLAIVMQADHFCMHWRGVKDHDTAMTNSVMRGSFLTDAAARVLVAAAQAPAGLSALFRRQQAGQIEAQVRRPLRRWRDTRIHQLARQQMVLGGVD